MKILIVEREQPLLQQMLRFFKREGYVCEQATNYREAYRKANNYEYDCVLFGLETIQSGLPRLMRMLRQGDAQTGIIVITARQEVQERIRALEDGADDVLLKPIHLEELRARIKALLRRKTGTFSKRLEFDGLILLPEEREVSARGTPLKLTKKEFEILLYLVRNKNRVVTKENIAEHLWGDYMEDAISFDFIYAHVKNLRKKLAAHGFGDRLKTLYGVGYKFETS